MLKVFTCLKMVIGYVYWKRSIATLFILIEKPIRKDDGVLFWNNTGCSIGMLYSTGRGSAPDR